MLNTRAAGVFTGGLIRPVRVPRPDDAEIRHRERDISRRREIAVGVVRGFPDPLRRVPVIPSSGPDEPERKKADERSNSAEATGHTPTSELMWTDGTQREERWSNLAGRADALHEIYPAGAAMSSCFSVNFFDSFG